MRSAFAVLAALALALLVSAPAAAQIQEKSSDLTPYAGILKIDGGDTELMFGARYGYNVDANNSVEGTIGLVFPGESVKWYLYHFNYLYNIKTSNGKMVPYATGGVGAATVSVPKQEVEGVSVGGSDTNISFNFGGGIKWFSQERMAIRMDVRDLMVRSSVKFTNPLTGETTEESNTSNNIALTGGISWFFY